MPQRRGLADWAAYAGAFEPIVNEWYHRLGRLPSRRELIRAGHGAFTKAAFRYHRGLNAVYRRFGYKPQHRKGRGRPWQRDWYSPAVRQCVLDEYAIDRDWAIGPACTSLNKPVLRGLVRYGRRHGGWRELLRHHGYLAPRQGARQRRWVRAIDEALGFREGHGRWPKRRESSRQLQYYRDTTPGGWTGFIYQRDFHPTVITNLIAVWQRHLRWCQLHEPTSCASHQDHLNTLHIERSTKAALTRLS